MIWTDGVHLITDGSIEELHEFAQDIGLKREWFQDHRNPHYDVKSRRIEAKAMKKGAIKVSTRELVKILKKTRTRLGRSSSRTRVHQSCE